MTSDMDRGTWRAVCGGNLASVRFLACSSYAIETSHRVQSRPAARAPPPPMPPPVRRRRPALARAAARSHRPLEAPQAGCIGTSPSPACLGGMTH